MLSRLRYALLLALALIAIYIGLWPSLLTAGALLGVPLALLGLVGIALPRAIGQQRWLHRFATIGGALLGTELLLLLAWLAWTSRRPVLLIVERPITGRVRVIYGVADGAPRAWWRWERRFEVPSSGLVYTQYEMDEGWYRHDNLHPMRAVLRGNGALLDTVRAAWVEGGTTQAGDCGIAYDEIVIGDAGRARTRVVEGEVIPGWLDSLATWGITCHRGHIVRAKSEDSTTLRRTAPACYYDQEGGMTCGIAP
jgi:hypothetical protein